MGTSNTNYIEVLRSLDQSTLASTGQFPEQFMDFLVIGEAPREAYLYDLENVDTILEADPVRSDDALLLSTPQGRIGVAYHQREAFLRMTANLIGGHMVDPIVKSWSIGPWLPEAFASDLSRAKLVRCEDAAVADVFRSLGTYPKALGSAIVAHCSQEIAIKAGLHIEKADTLLAHSQLKSDICLAGIRLLYAAEHVYFRGMRYIAETREALSAGAAAISVALESPEQYHQAHAAIALVTARG